MLRRILTLMTAALALAVIADCSSTKKEDKPTPLVKIHAQFVPKRDLECRPGARLNPSCSSVWRRPSTAPASTPPTR